jgi:hypothetical protein
LLKLARSGDTDGVLDSDVFGSFLESDWFRFEVDAELDDLGLENVEYDSLLFAGDDRLSLTFLFSNKLSTSNFIFILLFF